MTAIKIAPVIASHGLFYFVIAYSLLETLAESMLLPNTINLS